MKALLLCILLVAPALADSYEEVQAGKYVDEYVEKQSLSWSDKQKVRVDAKRLTVQIKNEIEDGRMDTLARKTDEAVERLVARATDILEKHNEMEEAYFYRSMYRLEYRNHFERMVARGYDIGDHKGFSDFLDRLYFKVTSVIGVAAAKALHISAIYIFNHSNVTFTPCSFSMDSVIGERIDEYRRHFAQGEVYYGTVPETCYWIADIGLMPVAGFLAGPIASAVEYAIARWAAPPLSDFVFHKACGGF